MNPNDDHDTIWMRVMLVIAAFLILLICIGVVKSNASEYPLDYDITLTCYEAALDISRDVEFSSADEERYAVGMLTAGCMYYDLMQQCYGTEAADNFAYPIEPDDEPSEFDHSVQ